jgi:hypothetical protein
MAKNTLVRWHPTLWTNASLAASVTGPASDISYVDNISVQIIVGAGATGDFAVQFANTVDNTAVGTGTNWYRQPASSDWVTIAAYDGTNTVIPVSLSGSAVNILLNYPLIAHSFMRVIYTRVSGSGTANVWINGKAI